MSLIPKDKTLIKKLLAEAQEELSHACMLEKLANKLDVPFANKILEPEWYTVLNYFKEKVKDNYFINCFIIQEVMMESLAIVIYEVLSGDGTITDAETAKLGKHILKDEISHVDYGVDFLKQEIAIKIPLIVSAAEYLYHPIKSVMNSEPIKILKIKKKVFYRSSEQPFIINRLSTQ
ncbi:long-chain fatty aldehyde decarbonylase [Shewanella surugensis]|uniref:Long-chain fatty aldehyde decarbonylase n=2 Tax=Shewanella surugensis TaxID=212020 RepID=A0ABT0LDA2_9GAMM|nr:long-chain fatty aldehyde decarbonylase [Shewanella surugensis]